MVENFGPNGFENSRVSNDVLFVADRFTGFQMICFNMFQIDEEGLGW